MRKRINKKTTWCFDLDGVICTDEKGRYEICKPKKNMIKKINKLFDEGCYIIIDSARGSETGLDWYSLTINQLNHWGVDYHKLRLGVKFHADFYVDDKFIKI